MRFAALLLDIGGVVIRTPFEMLDGLDGRAEVPALALAWRGPFDPDGDELWRQTQAGHLTEREYWARRGREIAKVAGIDGHDDPWAPMRWLFDVDEAAFVRPEVRDLIAAARRRGLTVGFLTNDFRDFHGDLAQRMRFPDLADVLVDRSGTAQLKPHPEAYAAAVTALDQPAERVLFVDDQPHNVAGARAAGLHASHFDVTDPTGSTDRVLRLLDATAA